MCFDSPIAVYLHSQHCSDLNVFNRRVGQFGWFCGNSMFWRGPESWIQMCRCQVSWFSYWKRIIYIYSISKFSHMYTKRLAVKTAFLQNTALLDNNKLQSWITYTKFDQPYVKIEELAKPCFHRFSNGEGQNILSSKAEDAVCYSKYRGRIFLSSNALQALQIAPPFGKDLGDLDF